jgi:hypothetical protein
MTVRSPPGKSSNYNSGITLEHNLGLFKVIRIQRHVKVIFSVKTSLVQKDEHLLFMKMTVFWVVAPSGSGSSSGSGGDGSSILAVVAAVTVVLAVAVLGIQAYQLLRPFVPT